MKKLKFALFILTSFLCFNSCNIDNSPLEYTYTLRLNIKNSSGVEILKEVPCDEVPSYMNLWTGKLEPNSYKWEILLEPSDNFKYNDPTLYICKHFEEEESYYLDLRVQSNPLLPVSGVIIHKLTSQQIFGDNEEHTIVSNWEIIESSKMSECYCSQLTIDGKIIPLAQRTIKEYGDVQVPASVAWLTLE